MLLAIPLMSSLLAPANPTAESPGHRYEGVALVASGWVLGAGWLTMKLVVTASDPAEARRAPRDCGGPCYKGPLIHTIGAPILVGAMGLLGGGLRRYNQHLVSDGHEIHWRWNARPRSLMTLGGSLLAGGGVVLAGGLTAAHVANMSDIGRVSLVDVTWWASAGLGISGAAILGVGHGRQLGEDQIEVMLIPRVASTFRGLSLSGIF